MDRDWPRRRPGSDSPACCAAAYCCTGCGNPRQRRGLAEGPELLLIEAFVAEAAVEGFHEAVLASTTGLNVELLTELSASQRWSSLAINSDPLSERIYSGAP